MTDLSERLSRRTGILLAAAVVLALAAGSALVVARPTSGVVPVAAVDAASVQALEAPGQHAQRGQRAAARTCPVILPASLRELLGARFVTVLTRAIENRLNCTMEPGTAKAKGKVGATSKAATSKAATSKAGASSAHTKPKPAPSKKATPSPTAPAPSTSSGNSGGSSSGGSSNGSGATRAPGGTLWGSSVMQYGNESYAQAFTRVQQHLKPEVIRFFSNGAPQWPSKTGSTPLVISFKMPPREVVNGAFDAKLSAFFAATPRLSYWTYWHEPEDDLERGAFTAAQYRAAWQHIAKIAHASGKPLRATLILMGWTAKKNSGRDWTDFYAGSDVIDVLAWDAYAWGPKDTPEGVYGTARAVSVAAGKPWAIAETGVSSRKIAPAARQTTLLAMSRYLATSSPAPEFVTYFDSDPDPSWGWNITRTPVAAAAWRAGQVA